MLSQANGRDGSLTVELGILAFRLQGCTLGIYYFEVAQQPTFVTLTGQARGVPRCRQVRKCYRCAPTSVVLRIRHELDEWL